MTPLFLDVVDPANVDLTQALGLGAFAAMMALVLVVADALRPRRIR